MRITKSAFLKTVEHTQLKANATEEDYRRLCNEAKQYGPASICVPPSWVKFCRPLLPSSVKVCTVIGFPFGYDDTETKVLATDRAVRNGASEIDMVINIGWALSDSSRNDSWFYAVKHEIERIRRTCGRDVALKVIVEACYLNEQQKIKLCHAVTAAEADYIKTSTGYGSGGATLGDVRLFREHIGSNVKIKAAGGISTIESALRFIEAGADRIGSSKLLRLLAETDQDEFWIE